MPKSLRVILCVALFLVVVIGALCFVSANIPNLPGTSSRLSFAEARARALAERNAPPPPVNPVCREALLDHGRRTPRVVLLLHGLSNCPAQYAELAPKLHAMGHNVFIPRMPFHGFSDRLTPDYGRLTLPKLAAWVEETLETAGGLGDEIAVAGLSVNGVTAAWIAQQRAGVSRAVVIAPFFQPPGLPTWLVDPLGRALSRSPNVFLWWNAEHPDPAP